MNLSRTFFPLYRYSGIFLLITALLLLSFPGNRSENDDGYFYAYAIRSYDYTQLLFPRYLIFLPFLKALYTAVQWVWPNVDAYLFMCVTSAISTAVSILIFYDLLRRHFKLSKAVAFCSAASLLFSYGYWRYSVEAEVYSIALLLCLLAIVAACKVVSNNYHWKHILFTAVLSSLTVLWYKPAGAVVCIALPMYWLLHRVPLFKIITWGAMVAVVVVAGYFIAFYTNVVPQSFWSYMCSGIETSGGHPLNAVPVIASNIVSLNFLYVFPTVISLIEQWFPGKQLVEEVFAARHLTSVAILASITAAILLLFFCMLCWKIRHSILLNGFWKNPFVLWLVIYTIALVVVDPSSPEPWIMILPALVAFFGIYFFPLIENQYSARLLYTLIAVLCLHNFIGGYLFIRTTHQDYTRYQSAWLIQHSSAKDMVISLGSASAVRYMLYYGNAKVFTGEQQFQQAMLEAKKVQQSGGKIYLTEDFVHPSETVRKRNAAAYTLVQSMLAEQQTKILLLHPQSDTSAAVYQWQPE